MIETATNGEIMAAGLQSAKWRDVTVDPGYRCIPLKMYHHCPGRVARCTILKHAKSEFDLFLDNVTYHNRTYFLFGCHLGKYRGAGGNEMPRAKMECRH